MHNLQQDQQNKQL